jgi:hypothetical protein
MFGSLSAVYFVHLQFKCITLIEKSKRNGSLRRSKMTQTQIPEQMTAVVLDSYSVAEALQVEQRPVPKPGKDEVLVKVAASPINPSDLAFLIGQYGFNNPPPVVPGGVLICSHWPRQNP